MGFGGEHRRTTTEELLQDMGKAVEAAAMTSSALVRALHI